jgi:hypothetical protein
MAGAAARRFRETGSPSGETNRGLDEELMLNTRGARCCHDVS